MSRRTRFSFTVTIMTAFALVFLVAVGTVVSGYRATGSRAALVGAAETLARVAETVAANTRAMIRPVAALSAVLPEFEPLFEGTAAGARDTSALVALLVAEPAVQGVSMGLPDGTLRQVLRAGALRPGGAVPAVPDGAAFALRERPAGAATANWQFLDATLRTLATIPHPASDPDPRLTQWYLQAENGSVHVSTLYALPLMGRPGLSVSRRVPGSRAVLGLDMTLDSVADFLARQRASPRSVLFVFTEDGILLGHQQPELATISVGGAAGDAGQVGWTSLGGSPDPLLRRIWVEYSQARLAPGGAREVEGPDGALLVRLAEVEGLAEPRVLVAVAAPLDDFTATVDAALTQGTLLALLALVCGLIAIGLLALRMAAPLTALTREAEAIRQLELSQPVEVNSRIREIAQLAEAMGGMKAALRLFGVYVPRDLVGKLMEENGHSRVGGERRRVSVMFTDIDGFTTLAEGLSPEELMRVASAYFEVITAELIGKRATIDKYIGDAVMAIWNAPQDDAQHAKNACHAALWALRVTERLCEDFAARGWPPLRTRFGIHSGEAVVGNVGSSDRLSYTAIGTMVNIASRLEGMNKFYGSRILVSEATRAAAGALFVTRPVDLVLAKGATEPLDVHELLGLSVAELPAEVPLRVEPGLLGRLPAWGAMVGHYRAGRIEAAAAALREAGDPAADPLVALYAQRIAKLSAAPPGPDWSPVLRFTTK